MSRKEHYIKEKWHLNGRFKINVIWRHILNIDWASQMVLVVKNLPANTGDIRDACLIHEMGRSPGGGHDNPLQYFCLESPHGQRSLVHYSPWSCKELDRTEHLSAVRSIGLS